MKYFFIGFGILVVVFFVVMGFPGRLHEARPLQMLNEMDQQQKVKPQQEFGFFADGRGDRMPIPGTVRADQPDPKDNAYFLTGVIDGTHWGDGFPVTVSIDLLKKGQERYNINCAVCHGAAGNGQGITSKYGLNGAANLLLDNYCKMADGEIFNTITHGKGQMMGYGGSLSPEDRWAIISYIRSLQRSQNATIDDVPPSEVNKLGTP